MCGRFTQHYTWQEVHDFLDLFGEPRNLQPRYNIAPTTTVDVVRAGPQGRELVGMRWQLIPAWWKKPLKEMPATFNARVETVASSPMFRDAFKRRRCIIPASGYYEWTGDKKTRQPHLFTAADGSPVLALAGLWDQWRDPASGEQTTNCTIVVGPANTWMSAYHTRMPAILAPDTVAPWLDGSLGTDGLMNVPEGALKAWPVSARLNKTGQGDDDPFMIEPIQVTH